MKIPDKGCWKSTHGKIFRHAEQPAVFTAFEHWDKDTRKWVSDSYPGYGPWVPCESPDGHEPWYGSAARAWAIQHPGRVLVAVNGKTWRYSSEHAMFQQLVNGYWQPDTGACDPSHPSEGTW